MNEKNGNTGFSCCVKSLENFMRYTISERKNGRQLNKRYIFKEDCQKQGFMWR